jgi:hypothetical protein
VRLALSFEGWLVYRACPYLRGELRSATAFEPAASATNLSLRNLHHNPAIAQSSPQICHLAIFTTNPPSHKFVIPSEARDLLFQTAKGRAGFPDPSKKQT